MRQTMNAITLPSHAIHSRFPIQSITSAMPYRPAGKRKEEAAAFLGVPVADGVDGLLPAPVDGAG